MKNKKNWMFTAAIAVLLLLVFVPVQQSYSAEGSSAAEVSGSALEGQFHLSHVVKIYIPSTVKGNIEITEEAQQKFVDQALTKFSQWFGGATAIDGEGAWVDKDQKLIKENVTIVYAYAEKLDKKSLDHVVAYAKQLKEDLAQYTISLEVDGKMYFIE